MQILAKQILGPCSPGKRTFDYLTLFPLGLGKNYCNFHVSLTEWLAEHECDECHRASQSRYLLQSMAEAAAGNLISLGAAEADGIAVLRTTLIQKLCDAER